MTRNIVIMAIVTVIMAVVLSLYIKNTGTVPAADNAANLTDGTYTSSAQGCLSEVAVTVTVTGGQGDQCGHRRFRRDPGPGRQGC